MSALGWVALTLVYTVGWLGTAAALIRYLEGDETERWREQNRTFVQVLAAGSAVGWPIVVLFAILGWAARTGGELARKVARR